jgi:pimeloyl-ACP methyl ester carboxylesterase
MTYSGKEEQLFKQISIKLNQNNFTTLLYDKRGVVDSKRNVDLSIWETADRNNLISDGVAAAKVLLRKTESTSKDLIIIGHSEGTIIATEVALALGGKVNSLILLGAQARSMKDLLYYQIVDSRSKQSSGIGNKTSSMDEYKKALDMINNTKDTFAPDGKPILWYRQHLDAPSNGTRLAQVNAKVSIFQGEVDPQTPKEEVILFKEKFSPYFTKIYEKLGHGFSPDKNGKPTLGPIDEVVLNDIIKVIKQSCLTP